MLDKKKQVKKNTSCVIAAGRWKNCIGAGGTAIIAAPLTRDPSGCSIFYSVSFKLLFHFYYFCSHVFLLALNLPSWKKKQSTT